MLTLQSRTLTGDTQALTQALNNPTLARVLSARGIKDIDELSLQTSHLLPASDLMGMDKAVARIDRAIDEQQKILIVGDFDCDGATSTALMVRVLKKLGAVVDFLVPDRFYFGYGLTPSLVEHAYHTFTPHLIITVDNGISSHEGVILANHLGIDVVITDHHLATDVAPDAVAVVNPNQLGCGFGSKALVGVGVAFYVMGVLAKTRRQLGKSSVNVSDYLDLVALGTIADVGVLDQNNRILVSLGLEKVRQGNCCVGILAILTQAGRELYKINSQDFGFVIAPRINAAGRMDNMRIGVECLLTDDPKVAQTLAYELDKLNLERRRVETQMKQTAEVMLDELQLEPMMDNRRCVILYDDTWHQGVIGIVAGRIKERLHVPTLIFAPSDTQKVGDDDLIKASARSINGVHIRDVLVKIDQDNPTLICHFGGHAMAAGLTIYKKDFERFCQAFNAVMSDYDQGVFLEQKFTDGELSVHDISLDFADKIKNLSVWGQGFAYPSFDGVFEVVHAKILKDKHLKLALKHPQVMYPIDTIWFNYDKDKWDYRANRVHILYTLDINEWQGNQNIQFLVQDLAVLAISGLDEKMV